MGVKTAMLTRQLRLNDILKKDEVIVDLDFPNIEDFTDNPNLKQIMYNAVINNYLWAYISADNEEQFRSWFKTYWERNIIKYLPVFESQIKISQNLTKAKITEHDLTQDKTETPELTDTTTYELGDTVDIEYGRTLDMTANHTDKSKRTEYDVQVVDEDSEYTQKDNNTYGGKDTTKRSGQNIQTLNRTGNRTFKFVDKGKETVTYYDVDKFIEFIKSTNILNKFIEEFAPLFMDVLFFA